MNKIAKKVLLSGVVLSGSLLTANVFAADTTTDTTTGTDNNVQKITLDYQLNDTKTKADLVTETPFKYSIDNYIYLNLKDGVFNNIKDLKVNLKGATDKTSVVYVCANDENIMDISFQKYKEKVEQLTDENKKKECEKQIIFAVTTAGISGNTFKFDKGDKFISLEFNNPEEQNVFSKIEIRDADNNLKKEFEIKEVQAKTEQKTVEQKPAEQPKPVEKKVVNTKKTGLKENILLLLIGLMLISVYNIKKRIES